MATTLFGPAQLKAIVQQGILDSVPAGKTNAIIGTVDNRGVQILVSVKLGDQDRWLVTGAARHDWQGDTQAGAAVVYAW